MTEPDHQANIHDFPWLEEATGVHVNDLGCVMLPVQFLKGLLSDGYASGALSPDDLYTAANPDHFWIKGDISGDAHVTVLYGLLTPAYEQEGIITRLVAESGWQAPSWLPLTGFDCFPSPLPDEQYGCIVARIGDVADPTTGVGRMAQLRSLLEYLPHVNTFPEYLMHASIAYVKLDAIDRWMEYLSARPSSAVTVPAGPLDLGSSH